MKYIMAQLGHLLHYEQFGNKMEYYHIFVDQYIVITKMESVSKKEPIIKSAREPPLMQLEKLQAKAHKHNARTLNSLPSIVIESKKTSSMLELQDEKGQKSGRTEISNPNEDAAEEKKDSLTNVPEYLYWRKSQTEDLDEEIVQKKMDQLWKFCIWKMRKWLRRYKRYFYWQ